MSEEFENADIVDEPAEVTDEELDFIINYDIKYRMGDELNSEE